MPGYKVWASDDVLTAADMNSYLMQQVVPQFASATTRSGAILSPPTGMITYRADGKVFERWSGSAWVAIGDAVGTVPNATNAGTAVYATNAGTAVYATNAGTAVYATRAGTAVYATNAGTAVYATRAGTATYATNAGTAVYAADASDAVYATTAGNANKVSNKTIFIQSTTPTATATNDLWFW